MGEYRARQLFISDVTRQPRFGTEIGKQRSQMSQKKTTPNHDFCYRDVNTVSDVFYFDEPEDDFRRLKYGDSSVHSGSV